MDKRTIQASLGGKARLLTTVLGLLSQGRRHLWRRDYSKLPEGSLEVLRGATPSMSTTRENLVELYLILRDIPSIPESPMELSRLRALFTKRVAYCHRQWATKQGHLVPKAAYQAVRLDAAKATIQQLKAAIRDMGGKA